MALKDLVATRHQLNESAIEDIIKDFIRYDPAKGEIVLTPAATSLPNKRKTLVYLVALEGWVYVKPELEGAAAKPAQLERDLGIPGGTLRPLLRGLATRRLVKSEGGAYRIVAANLSAVIAELDRDDLGAGSRARTPRRSTKKARAATPRGKTLASDGKAVNPKPQRKTKASGSAAAMFNNWIEAGFFRQPRTMKDMLQEFHNKGIMMKLTSLSKLPLAAVRSGALVRRKAEKNGKQIWLYSSGN